MRNWCQTMHPPDPWSVNNWLFIRNNGCHELVRLPAYRLRPDEALPCRPPPASPATSPPEAINLDFLPVSDAGLVGHSHPACCQVIRPFLGPEPPRRGPSSQFLNSTGRWTQKLFHFHEVLFSCRCYSWVLALFWSWICSWKIMTKIRKEQSWGRITQITSPVNLLKGLVDDRMGLHLTGRLPHMSASGWSAQSVLDINHIMNSSTWLQWKRLNKRLGYSIKELFTIH